jgi:hypothetical protein
MLIPSIMILVRSRAVKLVILLAAALAFSSCAAMQPPSATGPKATDQLYPILMTDDGHRKESVTAALNRLTIHSASSDSTDAQLQPVTGTILSLPSKASSGLLLPRIGSDPVMSEEASRESLRRFIKDWQELIGADPSKLSLVEIVDQPDGSELANYEQRPFRYPIRGNFGKLQIRFDDARHVLNLTSTCIPDADRIQSALSALSLRPKAEDAVKQLRDNGVTHTDAKGNKSSFKVPATGEINPRGLVIYVLPKSHAEALEFHLAWEMELTNAPLKTVYVDAVSGDILAAE